MIRRNSKRSAAFIQCHTKKSPPPKVNIVSTITAGHPVWQHELYFSSHKSVKCWRRLSLRIFTPHIFCLPAIENSKRFPRDFVFCHERFPQIFCLPYFLVVLPQLKKKSLNKLQKLSTGPDSNLFRLKSWNKKTSQKLWNCSNSRNSKYSRIVKLAKIVKFGQNCEILTDLIFLGPLP